jgi:hypothetical protein
MGIFTHRWICNLVANVALSLLKNTKTFLIFCLVLCVVCLSSPLGASPEPSHLDWETIACRRPRLKVLFLVKSDFPLSRADLEFLAADGFVPADCSLESVLGLYCAVFAGPLGNWVNAGPLPSHLSARILERFTLTGSYRVGFKVESQSYSGPLELEITAPREGFGKKLVYSDHVVQPECSPIMTVDAAGNRWPRVRLAQVHYGESIEFTFGFRYHVNMAAILDHDVWLAGNPVGTEIPPEVQPFLKPGHKIDPGLPAAQTWAARGGCGPPDARREYRRLLNFIKRNVTYDTWKRSCYFGGTMVYADLDRMYQDVADTLNWHLGACPDTSVLECTFLRARGIPCLTAGRFGHFFTVLYVPGRGWLSTSVTPTGIPLIRSPGPDLVPYQKWEPKIPLQTTHWEAKINIIPQSKDESCP